MAEDFVSLKAKLGEWLRVSTTRLSDANRGDMINMAQRELLRRYELSFGELSDTFETEVGEPSYAFPSGFKQPRELWYAEDSAKHIIDYLPKGEFDAWYPDPSETGAPCHFTWWGQTLYLGKTPDRVLTIYRDYDGYLPDLSDTPPNNTNALLESEWEVVFYRALTYATMFTIEDARLPIWEARAAALESDLVRQFRRARSAARVAQGRIP